MSMIKLNLKEEGVITYKYIISKIIVFITLTFLANNIIPEIFGQYIYILISIHIYFNISFWYTYIISKNISSKKHKVSEHNFLCSSIIFSFLRRFLRKL